MKIPASKHHIPAIAWMIMCLAACPGFGAPVDDAPSRNAQRTAKEIIREALLPPNGPAGRPLPLASHWNVGTVKGTFDPDHQIGLLQDGHHILPWMAWPQGDPQDERFAAYHERLLRYVADLRLPFSIRGTQWNAMLVRKTYRDGPEERWAGVIAPDGTRVPKLSPFGAIAPWRDPAREYVATPAMRRAQELYPNPPLVLFVSNNEPPDLRWAKHGPLEKLSKRYLDQYGAGRDDAFRRRVVAEGWMKRYPVMFDAMRGALTSESWRRNVRFVGYGAFGPSHLGRWNEWPVYSLHCDRWTSPAWHMWDGGSPSYYTHNWNANRDHWVFSCQVESMNWVPMLEEAWKTNPGFWFEISTWDGNESLAWMAGTDADTGKELHAKSSAGLPRATANKIDPALLRKSKTLQYLADGQSYPPERAAGWVQFGMWLVRPRAVREFRGHATQLEPVAPYWMETVAAVDRVWNNQILRDFWRHGQLVANRAHPHPWDVQVPAELAKQDRWFLLDTNLDPPRPWTHTTNLPVFSLALVRGESGRREWLVYAHSPLMNRDKVGITIPGFRAITIDVPRRGAFHLVSERTGKIRPVTAMP